VADSQLIQGVSNFESFDNLEKNAERVGLDFEHLPLVIQFNKRDLDDIVSEDEVRKRWAHTGLPVIFGSALRGQGVRQTFLTALQGVYRRLDGVYGLKARHNLSEHDMLSIVPQQN
jgi:mutual gliding-motility protein MglA